MFYFIEKLSFIFGYVSYYFNRLYFINSPPLEMILQYLLIKGGNLW